MVGSRSVAMDRLRTKPLAPASIAANSAFFSSWTLRAINFNGGKWLRIRRTNPSPSPRRSERSTTATASPARFFVVKNSDLAAQFRQPPTWKAFGFIDVKSVDKYEDNLDILK
jgi:hypothetical protein